MTDDKTDTRPGDPYRRQPAVIDLAAGEFSRAERPANPKPGDDTATPDEPATAIEPMAATGLDGAAAPQSTDENIVRARFGERPQPDRPDGRPEDLVTGHESAAALADAGLVEGAASSAPAAPVPPSNDMAAGTPPPRRGLGSLLAASLMGGVVGAAFALGADALRRPPQAELADRIAILETRPRSPAPDPAAAGLDRRVAALENQTRTLAEGVTAAKAAAEAGARGAAEAANRPPAMALPAGPAPDSGAREAVDALAARLDGLEQSVRAAAPAVALDELRTRLGTIQGQADERARANANATQAIQGIVQDLGRRAGAAEGRLGALSDEVGKLPPGLLQAGLRAIVAGQIADALRAGAPLGPGLSALDKLGGSPDAEALKPYATGAPPSAATLAAEFRPLAERITAEPTGPSAGFGDRLLRIADKIVTVKTVGDGSGDDVPGLVGRIGASLARGAVGDAATAWDRLPEPSRRISAEWGTRLKQRAAADLAAGRIATESLAALAAPAR